jgi:hypothetical protein
LGSEVEVGGEDRGKRMGTPTMGVSSSPTTMGILSTTALVESDSPLSQLLSQLCG